MSRYSTLLFDLDGTIIDSAPGVMECFRYTAGQMGMEMPENPRCLLGPPLTVSFRKYFGLDDDAVGMAVQVYREHYSKVSLFNASVYNGVPEMLRRLSKAGIRLGIATCKAQIFAEQIMERFGLAQFFTFIGGAGIDGSRNEKAEVIEYVLRNMGDPDKSGVLMIGDRDNDVFGAQAAGIDCMGVLWGYGSGKELSLGGAVKIADTPDKAADILLRKE